jgi:hypothetical protein
MSSGSPNPGPGSDFSNWTSLDTAGLGCSIALCSRGASVLLFFISSFDGKTVYLRESSDNGATWGARQTVVIPTASAVQWLAASLSPSGTPALFFASPEPSLYITKRTGGVWSITVEWGNSVSALTGLACMYTKDWNLALSGRDDSGEPGLWVFLYGDGGDQASGTWSPLMPVGQAQGDSDVEFHTPFLAAPDTIRLAYMEKYNGVTSSRRVHLLHTLPGTSFSQSVWRDPIPFDLEVDHGLALASGGETLWLSYPPGVWSGSLEEPAVDVSIDVLALSTQEGPEGARLTVVLDNGDGRYGFVGSGTYAAIRQGSEVRVSPGYVTPAGEEVSAGPAYWIGGWEYLSQAGRATFTLHCVDAWGLLGGWHARRQITWAASQESILDILTFLLARVGLTLSAPDPSSTITSHKPEFTVHPGQNGGTVARRLLALAPDLLFFQGHQGKLRQAQGSDATDYAFGTDHSLLEGNYARLTLPYTRVQVYGAAGVAERFSWEEIPLQGELLLQEHDLNLDTMQKADDRCQELLRRLERDSVSGEVTVGPNCGQELYDVVEVTDPRTGLAAAKRRVAGLRLDFRRSGEPRYLHRLTLGGV